MPSDLYLIFHCPFHVSYLRISPLLPTPLMMVFLICEGTLSEARQEEQKPSREPHREINRQNIREVRKRERQREIKAAFTRTYFWTVCVSFNSMVGQERRVGHTPRKILREQEGGEMVGL